MVAFLLIAAICTLISFQLVKINNTKKEISKQQQEISRLQEEIDYHNNKAPNSEYESITGEIQ